MAASFGCLAALATIVVLNSRFDHPLTSISFIAGVVLVYVLFGVTTGRGNRDALTRYGDFVYFLGYLTTIFALVLVAFRIHEDPKMLDKLDVLLYRGAVAISSTVVGLVGMFIFRVAAPTHEAGERDGPAGGDAAEVLASQVDKFARQIDQELENLKRRSTDVHLAFDQVLERFNDQHTRAVGDVVAKVMGLAGSVDTLSSRINQSAEGLETLHKATLGASGSLTEVAGQAKTMKDAVETLEKVSGRLAPAWEKVGGQLGTLANLAEKVEDLGRTLDSLQTAFGLCSNEMKQFTQLSIQSRQQLMDCLDDVARQAGQIGTLAQTVTTFADAARQIAEVAPKLNTIIANLRDAVPVKDAVEQLRIAVVSLNGALGESANATGSIVDNSRQMTTEIENLVTQLSTKVHELNNLAVPSAEFSPAMDQLGPSLKTLAKGTDALGKLGAEAATVQQTITGLEEAASKAAGQMEHLGPVISSFVEAVELLRERLLHGGPGPRGR